MAVVDNIGAPHPTFFNKENTMPTEEKKKSIPAEPVPATDDGSIEGTDDTEDDTEDDVEGEDE